MNGNTERLNTALAGRYKIEKQLGQGGMATVYLAKDLKHDRMVAVKVLKPELAAVLGAERFVVEIKTTAALQHPHILPLFDSGTADGFLYYVMPYIEGETLRGKLNRETQLGIDEAVRITAQVADALDYAHRHGVIHRDIKPENILLHDGRPMVADFGIALAVSAAAGGRMTETGLSLGTPHYMSPEQATAEKEITGRSDIYSLASVMFEMLTGNPPHTGASAQQIIMKIITEQAAPVTTLRKAVPPNVAAALSQALEKLPADRFESAKAFGDALSNRAFTGATGASTAMDSSRAGVSVPLFVSVLSVALVSAVAALISWMRPVAAPPPMTRFQIVVPDSLPIRPEQAGQNFAISPDGSQIMFPGGNAADMLYSRALGELEPRAIRGTEQARQVRFSPTGDWIAFLQSGRLKTIPVSGGPAISIADTAGAFTWTDKDEIIFTRAGVLWRVGAGGGTQTKLLAPDTAKLEAFNWPHALPRGDAVLLDIVTNNDQSGAQLAALRLDDLKLIPLGLIGRNPRYVAPGYIIFGRLDGTISAAPFDATQLRVTGPAVTVLEGVFVKSGGASEFGVSRNGTLFFVGGTSYGEIAQVDLSGQARVVTPGGRAYLLPTFSPTSGRIAYAMSEVSSYSRSDVWVYNDRTRTSARLTNDGKSGAPSWMADGERVVWVHTDSGRREVRRQKWDGTGKAEVLFPRKYNLRSVQPAPDGRKFAVVTAGLAGDIAVAEGDPPTAPRDLVATPFSELEPTFSPDGRWVAYSSDASGIREVFVTSANGDGARNQVSTDGGSEPRWSHDGRALFYRSGGRMMVAKIVTTPAFAVTSRTSLFTDIFRQGYGTGAFYDVAHDDKSFLMVGRGDGRERIVVVTGWLAELKARTSQGVKR